MLSRVSVSNLELFRIWKESEDLDLEWLLSRLRQPEQTEQMKAGEAFHSALENASVGDTDTLTHGDYRFDFNCDFELAIPKFKELPVEKQYGDLLVRGRVDVLIGKMVTDYKTTEQFDADRLWSGCQWRYYLDMLDCSQFCWHVFVLKQFGPAYCYEINRVHTLFQFRYPTLHEDCMRLATEYSEFAKVNIEPLVEACK